MATNGFVYSPPLIFSLQSPHPAIAFVSFMFGYPGLCHTGFGAQLVGALKQISTILDLDRSWMRLLTPDSRRKWQWTNVCFSSRPHRHDMIFDIPCMQIRTYFKTYTETLKTWVGIFSVHNGKVLHHIMLVFVKIWMGTWIGRRSTVEWHSQSADLSHVNFFLEGYSKYEILFCTTKVSTRFKRTKI